MNKSAIMVVIMSLFLLVSMSGCGSIHFFSTTHTHFYGDKDLVTDEAQTEGFMVYVRFIQARMNADAEPLQGFKWTDKKNKEEEKDF